MLVEHLKRNYRQYVLIVLTMGIATALKLNVPLFKEGLTAVLYELIVVAAALLGTYPAGLLAIILGSIGVNYVSAMSSGFSFDATGIFRTLEFLVVSTVIFWLAWRSRRLRYENTALYDSAKELKKIVRALRAKSTNNKKMIDQLRATNTKLDELVNHFLEDEKYWENRWR